MGRFTSRDRSERLNWRVVTVRRFIYSSAGLFPAGVYGIVHIGGTQQGNSGRNQNLWGRHNP